MDTEPREPHETTDDDTERQDDATTAATPIAEPDLPATSRRLALVSVIAAIVGILAVMAVALAAGDGEETDTSAATPTTATPTEDTSTGSTSTTGVAASTTAAATTEAPAVTNPPDTTIPSQPELPRDPNAYASAAFIAWQQSDLASLGRLASPAALAVLTARPAGAGEWTGPACDGAAGSTYCTWTGPADQLVLRVANEAASTGQPHALHEARFVATSG